MHNLSFWALWLASDMDMARMDFFGVFSNHFVIIVCQSAGHFVVKSIAFDCSRLPNNTAAFPGYKNRSHETFVCNLSIRIANPK